MMLYAYCKAMTHPANTSLAYGPASVQKATTRPLFDYGTPDRLAQIMASPEPDNVKAVNLFQESLQFLRFKDKLANPLFADPKHNPIKTSLKFFTELVSNSTTLHPTIQFNFFGKTTSVIHELHVCKKYRKKYPELKKFNKIIKENFKEEVKFADNIDKQIKYEKKLASQKYQHLSIVKNKMLKAANSYDWGDRLPGRAGFEAR